MGGRARCPTIQTNKHSHGQSVAIIDADETGEYITTVMVLGSSSLPAASVVFRSSDLNNLWYCQIYTGRNQVELNKVVSSTSTTTRNSLSSCKDRSINYCRK